MQIFQKYFQHVWLMVAEMAPYLLLGFAVAALLQKFVKQSWVENVLGKRRFSSIVYASIVGVPMPLCSCGVIPVTASIRKHGASKGAATSFLASTPQTGIDSILATYGMLGPVMATYRVIVAFATGILSGSVVQAFTKEDRKEEETANLSKTRTSSWRESLSHGFIGLPGDIANALILGFLIAGLISALAPADLLSQLPGGVFSSILLTTLVATPFYICSTGSIPLALALIDSGLPPSAALVLLIAGPATNIATISAMKVIIGGKETLIYLGSVIITAWIAALLYHFFLDDGSLGGSMMHHEMGLAWWKHASGVILILLLVWKKGAVKISSMASGRKSRDEPTELVTLSVEGMTCDHCRTSVLEGLKSNKSTSKVIVDLKRGKAQVYGVNLDASALVKKVESLGYSVSNSSSQSI